MTPDLLLVIVGVFLAVGCLTGAVLLVTMNRYSVERRRVAALGGPSGVVASLAPTRLVDSSAAEARRLARLVPKSPKEMARIQRVFTQAGYNRPSAVVIYVVAELLLPAVLGALPIVVLGLRAGWMAGLVLAAIGFLLPSVVLARLVAGYKKEIQNGLPDALDLLIVCLEAGSGLDQAIVKATEELAVSYPRLSNELRLINVEIRAGKPRLEAFKNFADRTKVPDVRSLVAMLVQTDRFGTSVAQALRTHADVVRTKRRQRAEERAAKLGVKLVFPLVLCLFPAMYVVTLGPAIIQFVRVFFEQVVPGMGSSTPQP